MFAFGSNLELSVHLGQIKYVFNFKVNVLKMSKLAEERMGLH